MERTIRVTGKGTLKVKPDLTRIIMDLDGTYEDYEETLKASTQDTECLKNEMEQLGFARTDLKTKSFDIDTKYESFKDQNGDYRKKFVGYEYKHTLKLEFSSDNALLGKVLYSLANGAIRPEFRISYTVKDPESAKNELLALAVSDAQKKAEILSKAAGVSLFELQTIDYSWGEIEFATAPIGQLAESCCLEDSSSYDVDIEPDDIDASDTVTMVWSIK